MGKFVPFGKDPKDAKGKPPPKGGKPPPFKKK
jgi:hypothetical protein